MDVKLLFLKHLRQKKINSGFIHIPKGVEEIFYHILYN